MLLCYIGADVPSTLRGDPRRLKQITLNLLANALRYTDKGHVILRAALVEGDAGDSLRVEVNDSGVGIDLEQTPRTTLLRPFEQAAPFSTRSHGGAGLGLSVASQLLELMGGRLDVESELGVGSTFWFTVPAREHTPPPKFDTLRAFHVLVVGQNARSRSMVATLLRSWGMRVRAVAPTETLRDQLRERGPEDDLILVVRDDDDPDNWKPAALRAEPSLALVPILVLAPAPLLRDGPSAPSQMVLAPPRQGRLREALEALLVGSNASAEHLAAAEITGEHRLASIPRGDARVLVVEDDPVNALIADRFLQRLGYRVVVASDGDAGLAAAEASAFDVILMDCQLPGMSGYQVTETVRAGDGPNRETPILAVTAHAVDDERARCLAAGMNGCLTKPYEPEDLGRRLWSMLQTDP
jgi:two-component system, sensor histidine kinase and response regulator